MSRFTRRAFLGGIMGGMAALPFGIPVRRAMSALPVNPGIVIVGGGVAGLSAARRLLDMGIGCIVLEAKNHLGGRAYTESETFGFPYDHGASWIRSADINPLSDMIRNKKIEIKNDSEKETWIFLDGREATPEEYEGVTQSIADLSYKIDYGNEYYQKFGKDVSLRDLHPPKSRFDNIAHATIGALVNGSESVRISLYDTFQQISTGVEWMVPEGVGNALLKTIGEVPVSLGTPVRNINWYNPDVMVETDLGTISTKAVIITVPPVLLAEKKLRFDPDLPPWKLGAVNALPMGTLDKVAFTFTPGFLSGIPESTAVLIQNGERGAVWEFHMRPFGRDMAVGYIGGKGANLLKLQGAEDATRAGLGALMSAFGSGIRGAVLKSHYTDWAGDQWARGSFSAMKPGFIDSRIELGKPISQRLFFAGEATSEEWSGSVTGAYLSGIRAAEEIKKWVKL